ncbi:Pr6Pr family membrane protein [Arthrobacter sp. H5]|uniref:Pr6Pr family membrane protein n=1 Tax=Arthrobacter sp. H5 TaxID=1267973 RepID=UPI0004AF77D9|nr:Pr6Pr family membrane protein [Arthrobacter sp. H5]
MSKRHFVIAFRLVLGLLALAGVVIQLYISITRGLGVVNFFSYFTILSNIFAATVFIIAAVRLARGYVPNDFDLAIRGASVVYMVFVGIVFSLLLRDVPLGELLPWINTVHHYVMPVAVIIDWILQPPRIKILLKTALLWLVFPAVYVTYSLIRGPVSGFYAYPFFDPDVQGGYGGVAAYCAAMLIGFLAVALLIRWAGNRRVQSAETTGAARATGAGRRATGAGQRAEGP